jgi:hypothetical protein
MHAGIEERRAAYDALEHYRNGGLLGCADWPALNSGLRLALADTEPELAQRALEWHVVLFGMAHRGDGDGEVTQCAELFCNLSRHLCSKFEATGNPELSVFFLSYRSWRLYACAVTPALHTQVLGCQ